MSNCFQFRFVILFSSLLMETIAMKKLINANSDTEDNDIDNFGEIYFLLTVFFLDKMAKFSSLEVCSFHFRTISSR